jgi:hypothetical protein
MGSVKKVDVFCVLIYGILTLIKIINFFFVFHLSLLS